MVTQPYDILAKPLFDSGQGRWASTASRRWQHINRDEGMLRVKIRGDAPACAAEATGCLEGRLVHGMHCVQYFLESESLNCTISKQSILAKALAVLDRNK